MSAPVTYSFLDIQATLNGPGGSISLGSGAGAAEEGISIEALDDIDVMTIGADGSPMHTLNANKSGKVTVRLLKTSPTNELLANMQTFQRTSSANHGQNTMEITNNVTGDVYQLQFVAFAKVPANVFAKGPNTVEWEFNVGQMDFALGAGVQV